MGKENPVTYAILASDIKPAVNDQPKECDILQQKSLPVHHIWTRVIPSWPTVSALRGWKGHWRWFVSSRQKGYSAISLKFAGVISKR